MGFRSWLSVKRAVGEATSVTVSETVIRGASYLQEAYRQRIDLGAGLILIGNDAVPSQRDEQFHRQMIPKC
jgi:hypothetical protein